MLNETEIWKFCTNYKFIVELYNLLKILIFFKRLR